MGGYYTVYANGVRRCPCRKCGSAMVCTERGTYFCKDCGKEFAVVGFGVTDKDLICKEIKNEAAI